MNQMEKTDKQAAPPPVPSSSQPAAPRSGEGNPSGKLGAMYIPTSGEDHAAQTQAIGARVAGQPADRAATGPSAAGNANPLAPPITPQTRDGGPPPAQPAVESVEKEPK